MALTSARKQMSAVALAAAFAVGLRFTCLELISAIISAGRWEGLACTETGFKFSALLRIIR